MRHKRMGRIHIDEEELSKLLGFEGGRIRFIGFMPEYGEIGIVVEHPKMPLVESDFMIPRADRGDV